jgi:hypothetical protein
MEAYRIIQAKISTFHGYTVYIIFLIAFAVLLPTWLLLRRFTRIWIDRPISFPESIFAGIAAWLFLSSLLLWFGSIALTLLDFLSTHEVVDIWVLIFSILMTGYVINFIVESRSDMGFDDTQDFIKEALQFRRSTQRRLDLLTLMHQRRKQKGQRANRTDPESLQRMRLQVNLSKGKELETQLALLREGKQVDMSEVWHSQTKLHTGHSLYEKIEDARIEPNRKRLSLFASFPELNNIKLKDEMVVLRFNRQVYDFLQSINVEPWLKPYMPFFESYYLMCRAKRINDDGTEVFYPFMKVGVLVSELRKLEGSYFNPRKLSEITALSFNNGAQV